jgi:hypothetical protein
MAIGALSYRNLEIDGLFHDYRSPFAIYKPGPHRYPQATNSLCATVIHGINLKICPLYHIDNIELILSLLGDIWTFPEGNYLMISCQDMESLICINSAYFIKRFQHLQINCV